MDVIARIPDLQPLTGTVPPSPASPGEAPAAPDPPAGGRSWWRDVPTGSIAALALTAAVIWSVVAWREWRAAAEPDSKTRLAWRPDGTPVEQETVR